MDFANAQQTMKLFTDGYTAAQGGDWQENYNYLADDYFGWDRKSSYDWMDAISRKGYYQDYNLNMQGRTGYWLLCRFRLFEHRRPNHWI